MLNKTWSNNWVYLRTIIIYIELICWVGDPESRIRTRVYCAKGIAIVIGGADFSIEYWLESMAGKHESRDPNVQCWQLYIRIFPIHTRSGFTDLNDNYLFPLIFNLKVLCRLLCNSASKVKLVNLTCLIPHWRFVVKHKFPTTLHDSLNLKKWKLT